MLTPKPFYYLRHGETDWNRRRVMQGLTDIPLNEIGLAQAEGVAAAVAKLKIATICCSPLVRARRTAEIAAANHKVPTVYIDDLKECGFGIYEGQSSDGPWREPWRKGEAIPEGESLDGYIARVLRGLNTALSHPGPVLVVAHGGTFWTIERYALGGEDVRIPNCTLFEITPPAPGQTKWTAQQLSCPETSLAIGEIAAGAF